MRTDTILSLLTVAIGILASPFGDKTITIIDSVPPGPLPVGSRDAIEAAVTAEDLSNFKVYAQYAGAAYCDPAAGQPVYCKGDICPAGKKSNATIYSVFHGIETDIVGFIAVDASTQQIIVSVRGSSSIYNWLADVIWAPAPTSMCSGCWAHLGFLFSYGEIVSAVNSSVASATKLFPSYKITVAGHSLGGAVATLLGTHLRDAGYELDVYTYGSPRVGNEALARHIGRQRGRDYRVTHVADLVARLPPINRGFRHTSPEYWLRPGPGARVGYGYAEVAECAGFANGACNAGAPWWVLDVTSHLYYLVAISHCGEAEPRLRFTGEGPGPGPVNGTTAGNGTTEGLDPAVADTLAMYAKLDQEYARALAESEVNSEPVF